MPDGGIALRLPPDVGAAPVGDHVVLVIDDFLADPEALVAAACEARFSPADGAGEGRGYPGLRAPAPAAYSQALAALLDPLARVNFGIPESLPLKKAPCVFSLATQAPEALGPLQRVPHFDASAPHHLAALLYLCDASHGGTAFYRHRATGLQQITADVVDRYGDVLAAELRHQPAPARYFGASDARFELLGVMRARFNRLVVYRGSLLHTAIVHPPRLSADPRAGRLTVNSFFDF